MVFQGIALNSSLQAEVLDFVEGLALDMAVAKAPTVAHLNLSLLAEAETLDLAEGLALDMVAVPEMAEMAQQLDMNMVEALGMAEAQGETEASAETFCHSLH